MIKKILTKKIIISAIVGGLTLVLGLSISHNSKVDALILKKQQEFLSAEEKVKLKISKEKVFTNAFGDFMDSIGEKNISLYREALGEIVYLNLEEYVAGVISAEMGPYFPLEALKAQAVAARTYAVKFASSFGNTPYLYANGADLIDTTLNQVYFSPSECLERWGEDNFEENVEKIITAVNETKGLVLSYNGELVRAPLYFSSTKDYTEDVSNVFGGTEPYLVPVASPYDSFSEVNSGYYKSITLSASELNDILYSELGTYPLDLSKSLSNQIKITSTNEKGRPLSFSFGEHTLTSRSVRSLLSLNSTAIEFNVLDKNTIEFKSEGYGHAVGMSQWGAREMAIRGDNYETILKHYYTGVSITNL